MAPPSSVKLFQIKRRRKCTRTDEPIRVIEETTVCLNRQCTVSNANDTSKCKKPSRQHERCWLRNVNDTRTRESDKRTVPVSPARATYEIEDSDRLPVETTGRSVHLAECSLDDEASNQSCEENNIIPWWEETQGGDGDDALLRIPDETLQQITNGALPLMATDSAEKIRRRITKCVNRKRLGQYSRKIRSKEGDRTGSRSKQPTPSLQHDDVTTSISSNNLGHKLLEKIGWTPGHGLGLNKNGIQTPISVHIRNRRQGLGYEKTIGPQC